MKLIEAFNYFFGRLFSKFYTHINYSLNYLKRDRFIDHKYMDYIRLATLELVADEIKSKNVKGNIAELGVYKGKFARYLNRYFPDRILYLFDTFEGFDNQDKKKEIENEFSTGDQDFSNTSVNEVLSRMKFQDKCVIKKGYFPDSAKGLNDEFAFVSIDTDLYDPIYNGLVFFYPRLVKGGYIFIHDYNNDGYKGAKQAVDLFCKQNNITLVPIPDAAGTAIITK